MKKRAILLLLLAAVLSSCTVSNGKRRHRSSSSSDTGSEPYVEPKITSFTLSQSELILNLNEQQPYKEALLTVTIEGEGEFSRDVTWETSNNQIATVTNGYVVAQSVGDATITATSKFDNSFKAICAVNIINDIPVIDHVEITTVNPEIDLYQTSQITLSASVIGTNNPNQNVNWSVISGNGSVNSNGIVTANETGNITIKATSVADESKSATVTIRVIDKTPIVKQVSVTLNAAVITKHTMDLFEGLNPSKKTAEFGSLVVYENDAPQTVTWSSSDPNKVSIDPNSGVATALAVTTTPVVITATSTFDSTKSGSINVTVNDSTPIVGSVEVSIDSVSLKVGRTTTAHATVIGSNLKDEHKFVTWKSSNTNVASIDPNSGEITAKAFSSSPVIITATSTYDTTVSGTASLTVVEASATDAYTIMLYICGADLESGSSYASGDIKEILKATGKPDDVNIIIETGGTTRWHSINGVTPSNNKLTRYEVSNSGNIVEKQVLNQAGMGQSSTLQSYLEWGITNYDADKMALIFWNHGGGLSGVCFDDNDYGDGLTAVEIKSAFKNAYQNTGYSSKFEWIGYDACLKQNLEEAVYMADYANYHLASQISEGGDGWNYTPWVQALYDNPAISTSSLLTKVCDEFVKFYTEEGDSSEITQTLSWLDLSKVDDFLTEFNSFTAGVSYDSAKSAKSNSKVVTFDSSYACYDLGGILRVLEAPDSLMTQLNNLVGYAKYNPNVSDGAISYNSSRYPSGVNIGVGRVSGVSKDVYAEIAQRLTNWKKINYDNWSSWR